MIRHPPRSTPFPYPTLFRSEGREGDARAQQLVDHRRHLHVGHPDRRRRGGRGRGRTRAAGGRPNGWAHIDRKSTRLNSSHANISYAAFCLKKKNTPPPSAPC